MISGSGSNLAALLAAIEADDDFGGRVVVVGSDRADAGGLEHARSRGIPVVAEELDDHPDRATWEATTVARLVDHGPEAVVLAGFMRVVSPAFLAHWPGRVLNVHPSLLPAFPGTDAVGEALRHGVRVTGVTVHLVDEQVDHGPIVAQQAVAVAPGATVAEVHARIQQLEHRLYPACVRALCHGELRVEGRVVHWEGADAPRSVPA